MAILAGMHTAGLYYVATLSGHCPDEPLLAARRRCREGALRDVWASWAPGEPIRHIASWTGAGFKVSKGATEEERAAIAVVSAEPLPPSENKGVVFITIGGSGATMASELRVAGLSGLEVLPS